ncbi:DUF1622 domain-containing protein [Providencia huaxiensis]|uniref:DUF1622 domain-containing protein n=2 Tax=Providencia TaxID=586 RepID=A0A345LZ92_9GAMM|nr:MULTISPECIES: DUF1622 domain-containing protein [Providencia]AXH63432.1 DUF1622 domain-containing protein [Providencia huaxiensis]MBQ0269445.1 DUF1622 domain-containing protein [Providencia huaxiensis]MBQ0534225.1 DUF1622 domain-containing protein [Providencia huaxiensis]MBQ0587671.1 DUF1622 domain-containing protein [Providencia huaxiensis]MBZ3682746.1 DUF1622 domain-containing protein [Providencia rettgeri]
MFDLVFLRELLVSSVHVLQLLLEAISVICVVIGLIKTLIVWMKTQKARTARYCFGDWLATALEFQLAADILATTVDPDLDSLIKLGIIAVIRTFLNYFLAKELEHQPPQNEPARH